MTNVDRALSVTFCAVPAFSRVEPATNSGPTRVSTASSVTATSGVCGLATTATVSAPTVLAAAAAATV